MSSEVAGAAGIAGVVGVMTIFMVLLYLVILAYAVVSYILCSKSLYMIAKRRGIDNPGLAWVPVANSWILGSISDQYHRRKYGHDPNIRQKLLIWSIISQSGSLLLNIFNSINNTMQYETMDMVPLVILLIFALAVLGIAIAQTVYQYKAYYSLYASCKPNLAVAFLLLSIFTPAGPFLVFACRNDDAGLPPENQE